MSQKSRQSDAISNNKRRSMVCFASSLKAGGPAKKDLDADSVITADRLIRFNKVRGSVAGNVHDEIAARKSVKTGELAEVELAPSQGELEDYEDGPDFDREEERDEVVSQQM